MHLLIPAYTDPTNGDTIAGACAVVGVYTFDAIFGIGNATVRIYRDLASVGPTSRPIGGVGVEFGGPAAPPAAPENPGDPLPERPRYADAAAVLERAAAITGVSPSDAITQAILETAVANPRLAGSTLNP